MKRSIPTALLSLIPCLLCAKPESIDYGRDILPILSGKCFECHGPDEETREADLRLDTAEGAYADLFGVVAIKPGDPENSELIYRINVRDKDEVMPPPDSKKPLTRVEKDLLTQWIEEGGKYQTHWAWQTPRKQPLPDGIENPVDAFVQERLKQEDIQPSEPAPATTLARRLFLDLIGLPPSPQEINRFVSDHDKNPEQAIDDWIDDLMSRPSFGEKWGRHWLDVARYADSNGFEKDKPREQWIYREWVINALNQDMPYDQFLTEQLAGDLIPNRTQDQLIASGFMRNGMVNEEGAIVAEQFRIEGIFDRMDAFGKTALGLTLQCAQCHTHKFDPITHDEYYGLFAFFNETHEAKSWVYSDEQMEQIASIKSQIEKLENEIRESTPDWQVKQSKWEASQTAKQSIWKVWDTDFQDWFGGLNHPEELEDHSILTLGHPTVTGYSITSGKSNLPLVTGMQLEALTHGDQPFRGPGRSFWGTFAITEVEVFRKWPGDKEWTTVELETASTDFAHPSRKLEKYFKHKARDPDEERTVGPAKFAIDGDEMTAWRPDRGPVIRHSESTLVINFKEPQAMPEGSEIKVFLRQDHGGSRNGRDNHQLGRYRFSFTDQINAKAPKYDHAATLAMQKPPAERSDKDRQAIFKAWRTSQKELNDINHQIAELEKQYPEAHTSVLHSTQTESGLERVTRLLDRGVWDSPRHEVNRHTPEVLNPLSTDNPNRLDLAQWITSDEAPLTSRVQVNRIWQSIFGQGLVLTPEDFGTRAPKPDYLNLLNWLAVDFRENGWSQKRLIKKILSSRIYQQSSKLRPDLREKDPLNTLLTRGPRFRAEAEVVRDIALAASGLLNEKVGGPSIFPPVPESVLNYNYVIPDYWKPETGPERYRRSLYMFRKRSMPDPTLSAFDAPNGDFSCAQRIRSNTPLSALTSLNEPVFVEATQAMALRILRESQPNDRDRVNYGYLLTTGRKANDLEAQAVLDLINDQKDRLSEGWLDTRQIAFSDPENPPELPDGTSPRDVASWAIASRVLLNLDETITKN